MFTGIIEELGKISATKIGSQGGEIIVSAKEITQDLKLGDSVAVNGVCLTVTAFTSQNITFDVSKETLLRSTLGSLSTGNSVNLERALRLSDRLGGHIVQGHVDTTGEFLARQTVGEGYIMRFSYPKEIAHYICQKGSIAIEGISLTIADLSLSDFSVAVVPHTWKSTTLSLLAPRQKVNLEVDIVAKYIERMLTTRHITEKSALTMEKLKDLGY